VTYPHALYFLELLINNESVCRELAQVSYRNFCHQQQYYAWQNRFSTLYGTGEKKDDELGIDGTDNPTETGVASDPPKTAAAAGASST
jgi:hypothetical protein